MYSDYTGIKDGVGYWYCDLCGAAEKVLDAMDYGIFYCGDAAGKEAVIRKRLCPSCSARVVPKVTEAVREAYMREVANVKARN